MRNICPSSGKVMLDKKGAETSINAIFKKNHKIMRAYPCPDCLAWHLTSENDMDFSDRQRSKETINDMRKKLPWYKTRPYLRY